MTTGHHDEEVLGKIYDSRLVRRLWPFLRAYRALLLFALVLIPVVTVFEALPARFFAVGLEQLSRSAPHMESSWFQALVQPPQGLSLLLWLALLMLGATVAGGLVDLARRLGANLLQTVPRPWAGPFPEHGENLAHVAVK